MNNYQDIIPWFKQPLVWMLIAIPLSAVVMGVIMFYLAVTTDDGLVAEDYYKKGLTINRQLKKEEVAKQLELSAIVDVDANSGFIRVIFNNGQMGEYPSQIQFALKHATKEQLDQSIVLQKGIENNYVGSIANGVQQGVWYIELTNALDQQAVQWRLQKRAKLQKLTSVKIQAH